MIVGPKGGLFDLRRAPLSLAMVEANLVEARGWTDEQMSATKSLAGGTPLGLGRSGHGPLSCLIHPTSHKSHSRKSAVASSRGPLGA